MYFNSAPCRKSSACCAGRVTIAPVRPNRDPWSVWRVDAPRELTRSRRISPPPPTSVWPLPLAILPTTYPPRTVTDHLSPVNIRHPSLGRCRPLVLVRATLARSTRPLAVRPPTRLPSPLRSAKCAPSPRNASKRQHQRTLSPARVSCSAREPRSSLRVSG